MIFSVIDTMRTMPERVRAHRDDLLEQIDKRQERIKETGTEYQQWLRRQAFEARERGETRLWNLHIDTLEAANDFLERTPDNAVIERVGKSAQEFVDAIERATTQPPIDDYVNLNVRQVMAELRDLDRFGLLRVIRFETSHRNRKTIIDAANRELERRARLAGRA
jgi:hypothetical protein